MTRTLRLFAFPILQVALMTACGDKAKDKAATTTTALVYADIKTTNMDKNCAKSGCHAAAATYDYSTLAKIKPAASKMVTRIKAKDTTHMPSGDATFAFAASADGVQLLNWLESGSDLK